MWFHFRFLFSIFAFRFVFFVLCFLFACFRWLFGHLLWAMARPWTRFRWQLSSMAEQLHV